MRSFLRTIWKTIPRRKRPDWWWFRMNLRKGKYKIVYPRLARKTFAHGKYKVKERTA